jgi:hypothetical protein
MNAFIHRQELKARITKELVICNPAHKVHLQALIGAQSLHWPSVTGIAMPAPSQKNLQFAAVLKGIFLR